ncbi:MAG: hypothetical protein C0399_07540 [Syntrophus sp. (in: bacteria)]|nr:hypothetical protein [Syntrophus sp. (in: bacteria)]
MLRQNSNQFRGGVAIMRNSINDHTSVSALQVKALEDVQASILNAIPHVVIVLRERMIVTANSAVEKMFGWKPEELIGQNTRILYRTEEEYAEIAGRFYPVLAVEPTYRCVFPCRRKDKKDIICRVSASRIGEALKEKSIVVVFEDITEQEQTEEISRKERETFYSMLQKAPYGVILTDQKGTNLYINPEFTNITGYALGDIPTGRDWFQKAYPDKGLRQKIIESWEEDIKHDVTDRTFSVTCGTGEVREVEFRTVALENGRTITMLSDITEKKKIQTSLYESQEHYRTIFENTVEGIYQTTPEGRFLSVNPALAKMMGYGAPDEMMSAYTDIANQHYVNPDDRLVYKKLLAKKGVVKGFETQVYRKDRKKLWIVINAHTVRDQSGNILNYVGTIENVTEKKQAEEALRESEKRYRTLVQNIPVGIIRTTPGPRGKILMANPAFLKIFGFDTEESLKKTGVSDLYMNPEGRNIFSNILLSKGSANRIELETKKQDGTPMWGSLTAMVVRNEITGTVDYFDCAIEDITEHKKAEMALHQSEEKFRSLFEESRDAIYITAKNGTFIDANEAFLDLFNIGRQEFMKHNVKDAYVDLNEQDRLKKAIQRTGSVRDFEIRLRKQDGTPMDCLVTVTPRKTVEGTFNGYQGIVRDITERKQIEETIKHLAFHDSLTGLANRRLFNDRLLMAIAYAKRTSQKVAVMMMDLDKFKSINDTLGHEMGDLLLKEVAGRLTDTLRESDTAARMGGDEFLVIISNVHTGENACRVADKIVASFREPFKLGAYDITATMSLGIAFFPDDGDNPESLVKNADIAMYSAKQEGRNRYRVYSCA